MDHPPLKIDRLVKDYGPLRAVDDVSFQIERGEIFGLLGPNGAGKTSIISIITSLQEPTKGSASIFGHDIQKEPKRAKVLTGCVPQELVNYGFFTIEELLHFISGFYGVIGNGEHIDYLIRRLGLYPHRHKRVKQLSGGMKRRLLIAKSLVHSPKLLLLDEPTAGVDVELRTSLWSFVTELKEKGMAVLLTTHYLEEAESLCDRVGIIHHGKLREVGNPKEIIEKMTMREVYISLKNPVAPLTHPDLISQTEFLLKFRFPQKKSFGELVHELPLNLSEIQDLTINEGRLEEAFRKIVEEKNE